MKLRAPAVPLITIDPYISIWSPADKLTDCDTVHWTGKDMPLRLKALVDGCEYMLMGKSDGIQNAVQKSLDITAMSTKYVFKAGVAEITVRFTAPMFLSDYEMLSRPLNYISVACKHTVSVTLSVAEEICQDKRRQAEILTEEKSFKEYSYISMRSEQQPVLMKSGDDLRIDWGTCYLCCNGGKMSSGRITDRWAETFYINCQKEITDSKAIFAIAYDDIKSIDYFGDKLTSYWNRNGENIENVIKDAYINFDSITSRAEDFDNQLHISAVKSGGEDYAELLELAYRQVLAAHKLVIDTDGKILYISKECFSNGCAATVDVSYPSVPLFLIYNPELIKGMMRPIFKYANMPDWPHDFAPHDVGTYPILHGQTYGGTIYDVQMPIEECGNMLLMTAAVCAAENDASFAKDNLALLEKWAKYLIGHGTDPENQLCTDDFAGHLAHNCNLSVKAIMAIEAMSIIYDLLGNREKKEYYNSVAVKMAAQWTQMAANGDGSYRLSFDTPDSYSMKYNIVWDKLLGSNIFGEDVIDSEFKSYLSKINPYGMPLDSRETYTKSDWLLWAATLADNKEDFAAFIKPLWNSYNYSKSRVPMTDWYDTVTAKQCAFQHRTVQGGLFIKLLDDSKVISINK